MTLDEYRAAKVGDVHYEYERRVDAAVPNTVQTEALRLMFRLYAKGSSTNAEKAAINAYAAEFAKIDPIKAAADAAKDRINALTSIPADDAYLLQW